MNQVFRAKLFRFVTSNWLYTAAFVLLFSTTLGTSILAGALVATATLREGSASGLRLVALVGILAIGFAIIIPDSSMAVFVCTGLLPVLGLSTILRQQQSWVDVFDAALVLGVLFILIIQVFFAEEVRNLLQQTFTLIQHAVNSGGISLEPAITTSFLESVSLTLAYVPGGIVAMKVFFALLMLAIGRSMQATLDNPGGFSKEFFELSGSRYQYILLGTSVLLMLFSADIGKFILPLALLPFTLVGVSIAHNYFNRFRMSKLLLVLFYFTSLLFIPLSIASLVLVAIAEKIFKFRAAAQT